MIRSPIYNRAYFENELEKYDNLRYLPISIIIGDMNGLKLVNDAFGHDEGDRLLKIAAKCLKESCRQADTVARYGEMNLSFFFRIQPTRNGGYY